MPERDLNYRLRRRGYRSRPLSTLSPPSLGFTDSIALLLGACATCASVIFRSLNANMRKRAANFEKDVTCEVRVPRYAGHMNIFLGDIHSLMLLRTAACGTNGLALNPAGYTLPEAPSVKCCKLHRLGISELLGYLKVDDDSKIGIVVPRAQDRIRAGGVECKVMSRPRGEVPFLSLASLDEKNPSRLIPQTTSVYVMSPVNVVLGMAERLTKRERAGEMTHVQTKLLLLKLCLELCGTYAHDPHDPRGGNVTYGVKPPLDAQTLINALEPSGREVGLRLAREVSQMVYENSGSPQESFMGPALFFPDSYGGLALADYAANKPLNLTTDERRSIDYRTITPDFTMEKYRSVVEYVGEVHEEGDNPQIDHVRTLDYQTLGFREFRFCYEDVRTRSAFMKSAARIANTIAQFDGPEVQKRYIRLGSSAEFIERQRALFKVFRPWLR